MERTREPAIIGGNDSASGRESSSPSEQVGAISSVFQINIHCHTHVEHGGLHPTAQCSLVQSRDLGSDACSKAGVRLCGQNMVTSARSG